MAFFKKLKERLFTLEPDRKEEKKQNKKNRAKNEIKATSKIDPKISKFVHNSFDSKIEGENHLQSFSTKNVIKQEEDKLKKQEKRILLKAKKQREKQKIKEKRIDKYVAGLEKMGSSFSQRLKEIQTKHNIIDEEYFEDLEESLIMSDISLTFVLDIIDEIKKEVRKENITDIKLINEIVADKMFLIYANQTNIDTRLNIKKARTNVILVVGVNGSGKTTSIAKLANMLKNDGQKVLIVAGDTFRAGAIAQLDVWAKRIGCDIVKPAKKNADPASVVFEALTIIKKNHYDILIIDTAGRLQNKVNLMNELAKINKIIQREIPDAPHESLLVIDATTGQNGVSQAKSFKDVTPLTGIILTKMDGTSKGGIVLTIKEKLDLAVKFIGLGEKLDDLQEFDLDSFIFGLTKDLIDE